MGPSRFAHVALLAASLALHAAPLFAQTADDLFDPGTIQEVRLFVNRSDLRTLEETYTENTYYTADLQWRGQRVRNVGIRSRGGASRSPAKPGLEIAFDHYVGGQRFVGQLALVLDNLWQDPSMVRERVAMAFFSRMGQPAPRESFCRLYINDVLYGLYAIVEAVTPDFLARTTGNDNGYLFEYKYTRPYYFDDLGEELDRYREIFEARSHRLEPDAVLYGPLRDFVREVNHADDPVWRGRVEAHVDLAQFVTYVAIEAFLAEPDGILGVIGMANFYLARNGATGPHRLIPWDKDLAFSDTLSPIFARAEENVLFRRTMSFPDLRALYLDVLEACARAAMADDWLRAEVAWSRSLIADDAGADTRKPYSNDDLTAAGDYLDEFAAGRPGYVLAEVARARDQAE
ncbi:MAG: CotH kinase family protein [Vicinamibacterales bacterium]